MPGDLSFEKLLPKTVVKPNSVSKSHCLSMSALLLKICSPYYPPNIEMVKLGLRFPTIHLSTKFGASRCFVFEFSRE